MARYTSGQIASFAETFRRDGVVMLPRHFDVQKLRAWAERFKEEPRSASETSGNSSREWVDTT